MKSAVLVVQVLARARKAASKRTNTVVVVATPKPIHAPILPATKLRS